MSYKEHKKAAPQVVNCAVIILSDTRTKQDDESGSIIVQKLEQNQHKVMAYEILKNDAPSLTAKLLELTDREDIQVIITSGGTGLSHRDITVDTVLPMMDKRLDGFGELFRYLTYKEISTASIMSRAVAGVIKGKIILCLPGSLNAVSMAMDKIILPEIGHIVRETNR